MEEKNYNKKYIYIKKKEEKKKKGKKLEIKKVFINKRERESGKDQVYIYFYINK